MAICPALAISLFYSSREGLMAVELVAALLVAFSTSLGDRKPVVLGCVLALMPLTKETGIALVVPFAVDAALSGGGTRQERVRRVVVVAGLPILVALMWRFALEIAGGSPWHTWVLSTHADDGPYVVAIRGMLGLEKGIYLRQNLTNAFIVNYLWLPALLALATLGLIVRRSTRRERRVAALLVGIAVVYAWTTLTFPTFTEPRYAMPLILVTVLIVAARAPALAAPGAAVRPRRADLHVPGRRLGADRPDLALRVRHGERRRRADLQHRRAAAGPGQDDDQLRRAARQPPAQRAPRRVFATDATLVTGDCNAMKFGEKLFSVGFTPGAYDRAIPGARPLKCVLPKDLPPGAANGPDKIALVRTPEEDTANVPLAVSGPSVLVIH